MLEIFLKKIFSKFFPEDHKAALLRIKELERMVETEEDKRIARMVACSEEIISNIRHNVNLYLINGLLEDYMVQIELNELINDILQKDFRRRRDECKQMSLLSGRQPL